MILQDCNQNREILEDLWNDGKVQFCVGPIRNRMQYASCWK
jgi:hypothetical protein